MRPGLSKSTRPAPAALAEWQSGVGNVIVARADGKALETATLGAITDYVSDIMEAFGDGVEAAQGYYN